MAREKKQTEEKQDLQALRISVPCVKEGMTYCPSCGHSVSLIVSSVVYDKCTPKVRVRYRRCRKCQAHFASRAEIE